MALGSFFFNAKVLLCYLVLLGSLGFLRSYKEKIVVNLENISLNINGQWFGGL